MHCLQLTKQLNQPIKSCRNETVKKNILAWNKCEGEKRYEHLLSAYTRCRVVIFFLLPMFFSSVVFLYAFISALFQYILLVHCYLKSVFSEDFFLVYRFYEYIVEDHNLNNEQNVDHYATLQTLTQLSSSCQ